MFVAPISPLFDVLVGVGVAIAIGVGLIFSKPGHPISKADRDPDDRPGESALVAGRLWRAVLT